MPILIITIISETIDTTYIEYNDFDDNEYGYNDYIKTMASSRPDGDSDNSNTTQDEDRYPVVTYLLVSVKQLIYQSSFISSLRLTQYSQ